MDLTIDKVTKQFGDVAALNDVSLKIRSGELVALLGPSGSGKTTLLRIVGGLEIAESGRVLFGERDADTLSLRDRKVGFVFQHYALFRHMTVFDNVAYGLRSRPRAQRPREAEIARRVRELLELIQLPEIERRYPNQLSGGQKQRVALARALAIEPTLLLLDEPFGALDAKVRKDLRRWLREFHDRTGHTTLFVTHDQEEALELADRVVVMRDGRVEQDAEPDAIYDNPASPYVFGFIGESSTLPVLVRSGQVLVAGGPIARVDGFADGDAMLHVRPHDIMVAEADRGGLTGGIVETRRTGSMRRVLLDLGAGRIEAEVPVRAAVEPGDRVGVRFTGGKVFRSDGSGSLIIAGTPSRGAHHGAQPEGHYA